VSAGKAGAVGRPDPPAKALAWEAGQADARTRMDVRMSACSGTPSRRRHLSDRTGVDIGQQLQPDHPHDLDHLHRRRRDQHVA
jgi:hypothetical protein